MKYNIKYILLFFLILNNFLFSNDSLKKVSLQLQWKHQFEFAGFYIAKEKGYYKDIGLDVELKEFNSNVNITDDVALGKTTFGINYPNIIYDKANGKDVVILNAILQSSPHVLLTLESSGINSIKDFKNKTIMSSEDALTSAPFISMLQKNKLTFEELNKIPHTFDINDIIKGKADIVNVFTSNEPFLLRQKGIKYKIWDPKDYGFDFYDVILFTSGKQIKENPVMVEAFNEASLKGWKYAFSNIDETVELILKKYNTQNKTKEALLYEANVLKDLAYYKTDTLGEINPNKIQRIFDIYNLLGYAKDSIDLNDFIYKRNSSILELTKEEKDYLQSLSEVRVFAIDSNKPLSYLDNGNSVGYANELLKLVAKKLNLKIKWINNMCYGEALQALKEGQIDIQSVYSHFRTSRDFVIPSSAIVTAPFSVVGRFDSNPINSINDLKDKKIVLVKGYQQTLTIEQDYPQIKFKIVNNINEAYSLVRSLQADYYIDQAMHSSYYIRDNLLSDIKIAGELPKSEMGELDLHFGIKSSMPLLHSAIQKALNSIDKNILRQLKEKWLISEKDTNLALTNKEQEYLRKNNIFTVCNQFDRYPISGFRDGKISGIAGDIYNKISEKLGITFNALNTISHEDLDKKVASNQCDLVSIVPTKQKRFKNISATTPVLDEHYLLIGNINSIYLNDDANLSEYTFLVRHEKQKELVKNSYPNLNIKVVSSIDKAMELILNNNKYHYIDFRLKAEEIVQRFGFNKFKISGRLDKARMTVGLGVENKNEILLKILNKTLAQIGQNEIDKIIQQYEIKEFKIEKSYNIYLFIILGIITIIAFFIFFRSTIIKRQNKELEKKVQERTKELENLNSSLEERIKIEVENNSRKEQQFFEQSKLAAMGEMIGNIAHQWRQPLSVISTGATGIILQNEANILDKNELTKTCNIINDNAQYLSKTIDDFRNFIKGHRNKEEYYLNKSINSFLNLTQWRFKNIDIKVVLDLDETICINGYENELIQCLINIANNAYDALNENIHKDKYIFIVTLKNEDNVIIKIRDNGGGIPENALPHIFEPYFTTKHQFHGTGLGLHMTYNLIVNGMNGNIKAENVTYQYNNEKFIGAEFVITLPLN